MSTLRYLLDEPLHSGPIQQLFDGHVSYTGSSPVFDTPLVVLLFCNRSGSNLASQYLTNTGLLGGFKESTNHQDVKFLKTKHSATSFADVIAAEAEAVTRTGRWFGLKASPNQLAMLARWKILGMFPEVKLLHSTRRDVVSQAISISIALQTQQWTSHVEKKQQDPIFDFDDITAHIDRICVQTAAAHMIAVGLSTRMHEILYEDLVDNPLDSIRPALRFLGLSADDVDIGRPTLQKQADETNARFIELYARSIADRLAPAR